MGRGVVPLRGAVAAPTIPGNMNRGPRKLAAADLRWRCEPARYRFDVNSAASPVEGTIGQDRALRALRMGLELHARGYNVFVCGLSGTGRTFAVKHILQRIQRTCAQPLDRAYVHNFTDPDRPTLLVLPRGKAIELRRDMERLIRALQKELPRVFNEPRYVKRRLAIVEHYEEQQKKILNQLEDRAKGQQFALAHIQLGTISRPDVLPVVDGNPTPLEKLESLVDSGAMTKKKYRDIEDRYRSLRSQLSAAMKRAREIERRKDDELRVLDHEVGGIAISGLIEDFEEKYEDERVRAYLGAVRDDLLANLSLFQEKRADGGSAAGLRRRRQRKLGEYEVNVVLDNSRRRGWPVVIQHHPTYANLFGTIELQMGPGGLVRTDFRKIKGGSLLQADGGYLVLNAMDILVDKGAWRDLKRTLESGKLEIQPAGRVVFAPTGLKPEPIDLDVKVVLIGETSVYETLYRIDPEFEKIFKVKAEFDSEMALDRKSIHLYAAVVSRLCREEKLRRFTPGAIGTLVENGVRRTGRRSKLSARFSELADLAREADYWARRSGASSVYASHVRRAIARSIERVSLTEEKIRELIADGVLLIDLDGERVGVVNGLSIRQVGQYLFGVPARITATVAMGRAGIIDIERESRLSGRAHHKGVLLLSGFLRERFAQDKPLSLAASLAFEQQYGGVDGDSASVAEIVAILSALAGAPVKQCVAVTGSINQKGDVQPIGGINEKIEGFFDLCRVTGLTGKQGVVVPRANEADLMLREDLVDAVRRRRFHVTSVASVEEAIEALTGLPAGRRRADGSYTPGSIFGRADARLRELVLGLREWKERPDSV